MRELLVAIGEDPDREGLRDTPARVARAYAEVTGGPRMRPEDVLTTTFDLGHDEMVLVRDIELWSMCEHHLVPFTGVAHVGGWHPGRERQDHRPVEARPTGSTYAKRPQVQERLTAQVADALMRILGGRGVLVVIEAEHLCMTMRGVEGRRPHDHLPVRGSMRSNAATAPRRWRSSTLTAAGLMRRNARPSLRPLLRARSVRPSRSRRGSAAAHLDHRHRAAAGSSLRVIPWRGLP